MTTGYTLNQEGEQAWLRLKQHLEWSDQFGLGFIFSAHPDVINIFRQRLAKIYRARVTQLHIPIPEEPAQLFNKFLPALLHPSILQQALQAPYWLDLSNQFSAEWTDARLSFLTRLNEQREPLRHALSRPLILVLPLAERVRIKALVPDLWAIRDFSLVTDDWLVGQLKDPIASELPASPSLSLSDYDNSLIDEWKRLVKKQVIGRDFLLAAERATLAALQTGHYQLANEVALSMKQAAGQRLEELGETPESLRDLSVSLNNVGDTAKALGDWTEARTHYKESLQISRQIVEGVGETPESLRDLSIALDKAGDTAKALGDGTEARMHFKESLRIRRRLVEGVGATPESLRDLLVSLDNAGKTEMALGDKTEARKHLEENLQISRQLIEHVGETPESLRALTVSLNNVGNLEQALGNKKKAKTYFEEGLAIAIALAKALPNNVDYNNLTDHFQQLLQNMRKSDL